MPGRQPHRGARRVVAVMGLECELNLAAPGLHAPARKQMSVALVGRVKELVPAVPNVEGLALPGVMTGNGSRIYLDAGDLIEIATPEVVTPLEAVIYLRANELILLELLPKVSQAFEAGHTRVKLIRCATSYDGHYRGMHVNVSTSNGDVVSLVEHLVPFLVTRFYACAGGIGPSGFTVSQKHAAVKTIVSPDARQKRGIIHVKNEPLSGSRNRRIHITHGDITMTTMSTYLTLGCTALVIRMLDDGVCVGPAFKLLDPIAALRSIDVDYSWNSPLPLATGLQATPLEIQEHYLRAAERYTARAGSPWMRNVAQHWRMAVDVLRAEGPRGLARDLDACVKMTLYDTFLRHRGITLRRFSQLCGPAAAARPYLRDAPERGMREYLRDRLPAVRFAFLEERMERSDLDWADLPRAISLYEKMIALDLLYHDISESGLFAKLCRSGVIDTLVEPNEVRAAMRQPPCDTRAKARGQAIAETASESGVNANWLQVQTASRRAAFPDPTSTVLTWAEQKKKKTR